MNMDIEKDVYAMGCRPIPEEIYEAYPAVMQKLEEWGGSDSYSDMYAAAAFYSLGIAHGVRKERQRRKKLMSDLAADGV